MNSPISAIDAIKGCEVSASWCPPSVVFTESRRRFFQRKYKFDLVMGWALLILFSPLIFSLWALVKLTSKGPGFYRQTRVGLNGKTFQVYKLRSMRQNAESGGRAIWCTKKDSRLTWLGKILRSLHLDELPQLFNVVKGEMSLIGPRPERPLICKELNTQLDGYYDRVMVKPGITGLSQINLPPDTDLNDVMRKQILDLQYINETTFWLEIRILVATTLRMFGIKGDTTMKLMRLCRRSYLAKLDYWSEERPSRKPQNEPRRSSIATKRLPVCTAPQFDSGGELEAVSDSSSEIRYPR